MCRATSIVVEPANPSGTAAAGHRAPPARPVVVAADPTLEGQVAPPSKLRKEQMKLGKKLHQILRLEESRDQGSRLDQKQMEKLARRTEVEEQLAVVEQALQEEEEEEQQQTLLAARETEARAELEPELVPAVAAPAAMTPLSAPAATLSAVGPLLPQMMPAVTQPAAPAHSSMTAAGALQCQPMGFLSTTSVTQQLPTMISPRPQPAVPMPAPHQPLLLSATCATVPQASSSMPITVFLVPVQVTGPQADAAAPQAQGPVDAVPGAWWAAPNCASGASAWAPPAAAPAPTMPAGGALGAPPALVHQEQPPACAPAPWPRDSANSVVETIQPLKGSMLRMSPDAAGCREVQEALQALDQRTAAELLMELQGRVPALIKSPYGNYVIQKVIEIMPPAQCGFVVAELRGWAANAAKHKFGCRILCRLLEHSTVATAGLREIMDELLQQADELIRHPYAHHVIEALLEHGCPEQRRRVTEALCWDVLWNSSDRHGCYVMEAAAAHCDAEEQEMLVQAHLRLGMARLMDLAQSRYGSLSVKALLKCQSSMGSCGIVAPLKSQARLLSQTKYGRRLLQELSSGKSTQGCHAAIAA